MARPAAKWNADIAAKVRENASKGVPQEVIGLLVGLSEPTLRKVYRAELDESRAKALSDVVGALWHNAVVEKNPTAQIFICKTQMGWKETQRVEQSTQSVEKLIVRIPDNGRD